MVGAVDADAEAGQLDSFVLGTCGQEEVRHGRAVGIHCLCRAYPIVWVTAWGWLRCLAPGSLGGDIAVSARHWPFAPHESETIGMVPHWR